MKRGMAVESQRIDSILKEFDQPTNIEPPYNQYVPPKRQKNELANDYIDLYKNFSEFNAKNIPERSKEIKVGDYY